MARNLRGDSGGGGRPRIFKTPIHRHIIIEETVDIKLQGIWRIDNFSSFNMTVNDIIKRGLEAYDAKNK